MIPHRSTALLIIIVFVALLLVIFSSSSAVETAAAAEGEEGESDASKYRLKLPSLAGYYLPYFRPYTHKPYEQKNSTSGESKWFSEFTWISPFSSSITLDEDRSVLPPLPQRPSIYAYYDLKDQGNTAEMKADAELILTWRRAWFAQGFYPVVLGRQEAMNNPYYERVQKLKLHPELQQDFFRWLAWGDVGTGLLSDLHCFPMARYDDEMLSYLRRGAVNTHITRFDRVRSCLFAGEKTKVNDAINDAISGAIKNESDRPTSMLDVIPSESFRVEDPNPFAFYSSSTIATHYPSLSEKIGLERSSGKLALVELINSHLHNSFQNAFPAGIAVLKPFQGYTASLVEPALRLAKSLGHCPAGPIQRSCPPNRPTCEICDPERPIRTSQPDTYKNASHLFTIGTIPHPYTFISLKQRSQDVTVRYIRRETERDPWLKEVTKEHLDPRVSSSLRAMVMKQVVADDVTKGNSLWVTAETHLAETGRSFSPDLLDELEWQLGFKIPRDSIDADTKDKGRKEKETMQKSTNRPEAEIEYDVIQKARNVLASKDTDQIKIKDAVEAWNLADTEIWRFVRAYRARCAVERQKWEEMEKPVFGTRAQG